MYQETIDYFSAVARKKADFLSASPMGFFVGSVMAGGYVGLGIILIFSVASPVSAEYQKLIMGMSFGVALTLVVFAGSELFTGHTMYMTFGYLQRRIGVGEIIILWLVVWVGNLLGSVGLAWLFALGGGGNILGDSNALINQVADYKMNAAAIKLVARGALCNWLVCLAIWMAARTTSDSGKAIAIFWALFTFIASGYEHSVANMTLLTLALLSEHPETITVAGMAHNLLWVTVGNIIGGSLFMGLGYWWGSAARRPTTDNIARLAAEKSKNATTVRKS